MLEQKTVYEILVYLLMSGGLSVLLERIPAFQKLSPRAKDWLFKVLAFVAPAALAGLSAVVPAEVLSQTPLALLIALAGYWVTQAVHALDKKLFVTK